MVPGAAGGGVVPLGGVVVEAEGLGEDWCRGLEHELAQRGEAAGDGRDAEVPDERGDRVEG
ncbi:hypothetical protein ABGB16_29535 [Micromonospora sp. B11E3]|uniref:hypothetical protein n=1 Tax=Micromonospora sp. B11E3 TaxID=3153562 RepID=UPI00325CB04C